MKMTEDSQPTSPIPRKRQIPVKDQKPVKVFQLALGPTYSKEMIDLLINEGYSHYAFPDGTVIKIFKLTNPQCVGMKLEVGAATPDQYHLVGVMEEGWQPTVTH